MPAACTQGVTEDVSSDARLRHMISMHMTMGIPRYESASNSSIIDRTHRCFSRSWLDREIYTGPIEDVSATPTYSDIGPLMDSAQVRSPVETWLYNSLPDRETQKGSR